MPDGDQATTYHFALDRDRTPALDFEAAEDVFIPTQTSRLLIQGVRQTMTAPGTVLDLGCGIGVCGIALTKLGLCQPPTCFSDLSGRAVELTARNARAHGVEAVVRQGSLLTPWAGESFDLIVDDVSGVAEAIARHSSWFPAGVACDSGPDGTALVTHVIAAAPQHLNPGGRLIFPVLSLSCERRILEIARAVFEEVSLVTEQSWFLPEELQQRFDVLQPLLDAGVITLEHKFGAWLWSTKIYQASLARAGRRAPQGA